MKYQMFQVAIWSKKGVGTQALKFLTSVPVTFGSKIVQNADSGSKLAVRQSSCRYKKPCRPMKSRSLKFFLGNKIYQIFNILQKNFSVIKGNNCTWFSFY